MKLSYERFLWNITVWRERMSWFRRGTEAEDKLVAEAGRLLTDAVSDADHVATIELKTGRNLRDQLTVEDAENMRRETELRGFGWRRN